MMVGMIRRPEDLDPDSLCRPPNYLFYTRGRMCRPSYPAAGASTRLRSWTMNLSKSLAKSE